MKKTASEWFRTLASRQSAPNYIIWDIDGVFNPYLASDLIERNFKRYSQGWVEWDLNVETHGAWLQELEEMATFVWGSDWESESNLLAQWFRLKKNEYPHIPLPRGKIGGKLAPVSRWIEDNVQPKQKVVWVEDELQDNAFQWAARRTNVLLVKPDPSVGLTYNQVQAIKSFLS